MNLNQPVTSVQHTQNHKLKNSQHFNVILLRHAQSLHNQTIRRVRQQKTKQNKMDQFKEIKKRIKYGLQYVDSEEINIDNLIKARKQFEHQIHNIDLVITSPLARCIQTSIFMMGDNKQNIKIILQPLLTSPVQCSWTIGKSIKSKKQFYKDNKTINFDECGEEDFHWTFDNLLKNNEHFKKYIQTNYKDILLKDQPSSNHNSKAITDQQFQYQKILLNYLEHHSKIGQPNIKVNQRIVEFKLKFVNKYLPLVKQKKKVLIVTHGEIIKYLLVQDVQKMYNMDVKSVKIQNISPIYCRKQMFLIENGEFLEQLKAKTNGNQVNQQ